PELEVEVPLVVDLVGVAGSGAEEGGEQAVAARGVPPEEREGRGSVPLLEGGGGDQDLLHEVGPVVELEPGVAHATLGACVRRREEATPTYPWVGRGPWRSPATTPRDATERHSGPTTSGRVGFRLLWIGAEPAPGGYQYHSAHITYVLR